MQKGNYDSYESIQKPLVTNNGDASPSRTETSGGYSDDQRMIYYGKRQQFKVSLYT